PLCGQGVVKAGRAAGALVRPGAQVVGVASQAPLNPQQRAPPADGSLVDVPPAELRGAVGERLGAVDRVPAEREPLPAPDVDEDPARLFAIAGGAVVVRAADGQARRASRPRGPGDDLVAVDVDDAGLVGDLTRLQGGAHGVSS